MKAVSEAAPEYTCAEDMSEVHKHRSWKDCVRISDNASAPQWYRWAMCAQHSTAQHSAAQHSAAQHSAAQHSAAQRSTAEHSAAQHIRCGNAPHIFTCIQNVNIDTIMIMIIASHSMAHAAYLA